MACDTCTTVIDAQCRRPHTKTCNYRSIQMYCMFTTLRSSKLHVHCEAAKDIQRGSGSHPLEVLGDLETKSFTLGTFGSVGLPKPFLSTQLQQLHDLHQQISSCMCFMYCTYPEEYMNINNSQVSCTECSKQMLFNTLSMLI